MPGYSWKEVKCVKIFNKERMIGTACAVLAAWTLMFALTVSATSTSDKVKDAQDDVNTSKEKLNESKQEADEAKELKTQLEGKLAQLNEQLGEVSGQLSKSQDELVQKQKEIETIKVQLASAEAVETEQYEDMKKRIQFMYENAGSDMLQMIFEGESFTEILNKADYFQQMTQYDRKMLDEYSATKQSIQTAKATLETEEAELKTVVADIEEKKKEVSHLVSQTSGEVAKQQENLQQAEEKALAYEKELEEQQNSLQALKEQEAKEKAVREEQERQKKLAESNASSGTTSNVSTTGSGSTSSSSSTGSGYSSASQSGDLKLLATIIYCEAGNQPYDGMIAVGSVVMNRINSPVFPDTMIGVLYQKSQFTPVMSGRFAIALANDSATDRCYSAAQEVLNGKNNVPDCLFFRTVIPGKEGTIIGDHVFY